MKGKILVDVMLSGGAKFYKTLVYRYNPVFKLNINDVIEWAYKQLPSLTNRKDVQFVFYTN